MYRYIIYIYTCVYIYIYTYIHIYIYIYTGFFPLRKPKICSFSPPPPPTWENFPLVDCTPFPQIFIQKLLPNIN